MVKHIELNAKGNCYDAISVAAVPEHGQGFWKSNGFKEVTANAGKGSLESFVRDHMLVFEDTLLFFKTVST